MMVEMRRRAFTGAMKRCTQAEGYWALRNLDGAQEVQEGLAAVPAAVSCEEAEY